MKIRTLSLACVTTAAVLLAGCTAVYKNTDACEQMMRSKLADVSPDQLPEASIDKLSVDHTGTGIHGSRVVVEGSLSHMQTASEVAAASAPNGASGASAVVATAKPVKPQKVVKAAAVECTFTGLNLASFRWLAPAELVKTNEDAASDSAE
ncbi:hypothetical protein [Paraburkholderia phenazinium]|uniref:Lipoprotein n=1 Tax=Paraburkholderia phenazinium TaxID=60549 RepID=A0A1G8H809_9BURK|nr:hypothetical protein [Paraburkholderia phenazinium]SDI02814.1 hypothetical protein SAMN05216466_11647 [Paraburkholderia phenazinium]